MCLDADRGAAVEGDWSAVGPRLPEAGPRLGAGRCQTGPWPPGAQRDGQHRGRLLLLLMVAGTPALCRKTQKVVCGVFFRVITYFLCP